MAITSITFLYYVKTKRRRISKVCVLHFRKHKSLGGATSIFVFLNFTHYSTYPLFILIVYYSLAPQYSLLFCHSFFGLLIHLQPLSLYEGFYMLILWCQCSIFRRGEFESIKLFEGVEAIMLNPTKHVFMFFHLMSVGLCCIVVLLAIKHHHYDFIKMKYTFIFCPFYYVN